MDKRPSGSSVRTGAVVAVLAVLSAYFLMFVDDGVPAVADTGVLILTGWCVVAGTIVTGLALVTRRATRRLGLGLLVGTVVASFLAAAALSVFVLWAASTIGS
jgi:hypothetical protein